jgi:PPOX class probable F420-dependent enzyme
MSIIDTSSEFGQRVAKRLADEQVAWLVTVDSSGTPQPNPVWFIWDGETALIYSQPNQAKIRNIERSGHASLNFNSDFHGGDVVVLTGTAQVEPAAPSADQNPAFIEKYADGIASINMTPESFAASYSAPILITPTKLRGF